MDNPTKNKYSLYDLSTQSGIVRKKNLTENNSQQTISFYDASVNSNHRNDSAEKKDE